MAAKLIREKPARFSAPEVRATLEGRKTQHMFVMTHQPPEGVGDIIGPEMYAPAIEGDDGMMRDGNPIFGAYSEDGEWGCVCPYQVGMRLWVRETWMPLWDAGDGTATCLCPSGHQDKPDFIKYRADGEKPHNFGANWRSSRFMPRKHCRITLEITGVRVERVNEISEADAKAEGCIASICPPGYLVVNEGGGAYEIGENFIHGIPKVGEIDALGLRVAHVEHRPETELTSALQNFRWLWDTINGKRPGCSWADNPWTWCVEFRRVETGKAE